MAALLVNFSVPAGDGVAQAFNVAAIPTLAGHTVYWGLFSQVFGVPQTLLVSKESASGHGITILPSPPNTFVVDLLTADTQSLLGNYYHEARVVDGSGNITTVIQGICTVTMDFVVT